MRWLGSVWWPASSWPGLATSWSLVCQPAESWFNLWTQQRIKHWIVFFWVREVHWLSEGSEEGESLGMALGRTAWLGAGKEQEGPGLLRGQLCSLVTSSLAQVRMQVSSLWWSLSIFADATALPRRALTPSESAAGMIDAILALGFTSCQKEQTETLKFSEFRWVLFICHSLCSCTGCLPPLMFCLELDVLESGGHCYFFSINTLPNSSTSSFY